ncbi:MAG: hypothetical protein ACREBG_19585, partial [Pyrinomonadaceae bacterium]
GRPKGSKNKPKAFAVDSTPVDSTNMVSNIKSGTATVVTNSAEPGTAGTYVTSDPFDQKLAHFQYATDEHSGDVWEHGEGINPLDLPKAIREGYPHLRFRWCSEPKWDKKGKNYDGWQRFTDPKLCPDGERRGRDLFLAAMPEERARKRDRFVQQRSTDMIKSVQERNLDTIAQIQHGESQGIAPLDTPVHGVQIGRRPETRIPFGGKVRKGGGYNRGLSMEEVQEVVRKNRESEAKRRKYFT